MCSFDKKVTCKGSVFILHTQIIGGIIAVCLFFFSFCLHIQKKIANFAGYFVKQNIGIKKSV
jgi:hypothetical protein